MDNRAIARRLLDMAHRLEMQHASMYRVRAYRQAAETVLGLEQPVEQILTHDGGKSLEQLPGIGRKLSAQIETLVRTGRIANLTGKPREPLRSSRSVDAAHAAK